MTALLLGTSMTAWASAATAPESADAEEARIEPSDNLCFGGLEDGKIIVGEQYLKNPYRETTRLGCEVDGGAPVTMPDLPAPDAARTRLV
jgi:hypothetical protein